eukprot:NODE_4901_length_1003_cov_111.312500_g4694_i0.p1 GENE.NODE_4901_length_1003_cov_111.312500_g4694_i0~~NODE_4901_length_1003_cov_111.312500_g4694_i0.p1  ORF type:complete len:247 (-),score=63.01 NODE_4901_length_1003_cov_111.312500_g4694_i0:178-918(-)
MQDVYEVVKDDILASWRKIEQENARWQTARRSDDDRSFEDIHKRLLLSLENLESDLNDMRDTNKIVQTTRRKFDISDAALAERMKFVDEMCLKVKDMNNEVANDTRAKNLKRAAKEKGKATAAATTKYQQLDEDMTQNQGGHDDFINNHLLEQATLEKQQDEQIGDLSNAVTRLKKTGETINTELQLQDKMLDELDQEMDTLGAKLSHAMKKVEKLLENSKDRSKICCIVILIVILVVLIVIVFSF